MRMVIYQDHFKTMEIVRVGSLEPDLHLLTRNYFELEKAKIWLKERPDKKVVKRLSRVK